jgi:hypothetical protein
MSSIVFEVILHPDPTLRRLVAWTGIAAASGGIILVANLQISPLWRCAIGAIWLAASMRELRDLYRGNNGLSALILDSRGCVAATDADGDRHELTLLSGSMVLPGVAWFRLRSSRGKCHAELFTRQRSGSETWHRLRLLWRQAREAFGHPPRP